MRISTSSGGGLIRRRRAILWGMRGRIEAHIIGKGVI